MDNYLPIEILNTILDRLDKIEIILKKNKNGKDLNDNGFISIEELCWTFKLSKDTVRRYRREGIIPSYKIKGKVYFKMDEVKNAIKEHVFYGSNRSK